MGTGESGRRRILEIGYALKAQPECASLDRGSSRRTIVMRRRSADIRVINRRNASLARGLLRQSHPP